jgi:UDP-N-acetylmuramate dehydrogenase
MKRFDNASLKHLNSFAVEAHARRLFVLESENDFQALQAELKFNPATDLILGGGSNILLTKNIDGAVILNRMTGKRIIEESADTVLLEVSAGENWHDLVLWSLEQGLSGIENLSLIPGCAGAAPMQNIGAYGVELADVLESVRVLDMTDGNSIDVNHSRCQFGYRHSRFKTVAARYDLITHIRLRLHRNFIPRLTYAGIDKELDSMGIDKPTAKQVSDAVIRIRRRKLPDPSVTGNAGSFFKNPVVSGSRARLLKNEFAKLPVYPMNNDTAKLSAAWLIEQCGWKGQAMGNAAVSDQHALVLINTGKATGREILDLADAIGESIKRRFDIQLQTEPQIL